jgi:serine/threonine protein kinase
MKGGMDYWLGQLLSLIFYIMTIVVYNRARKEYVGGKIAAAINLIMVFLLILFVNDFVDYFLITIAPVEPDIVTILKIFLKLIAIGVLFFGGLRFFATGKGTADIQRETNFFDEMDTETQTQAPALDHKTLETVVLDAAQKIKKPTLGRYEILGQIGKGAMGIVYKGRDPKLNRLTAIKTIRFIDEYDEDKVEEFKAHFYREAEVVARLAHKNIVTIFDVGEDLDVSYLAMEYLEGESLEHYTVQGDLLPMDACINIIIQVCDALDYAHHQGIIHRDIKPGNIMLLADGLVKVMDFGIARAAGGTKTRTGIIKGTPFYMSPEQAKGADLTGASDIFALGVVFYQLLTGKLPFTGDTLAAIMYQSANTDPVPADSYNENISRDVLDILNKALRKNPEDRFKSAKDMADALRKLLRRPDTVDLPASVNLFDTEDEVAAAQSVRALQQVPGKQLELQESVDFEDLDQVLRDGALSNDGVTKPFTTTEDLPAAESAVVERIDAERDDQEGKLDLSELREVLAERKKRLARLDGQDQAREGREETAAGQDRDQEEPDWKAYSDKKVKAKSSGRFVQAAYLAVALAALAGATYYFWLSPGADKRVVKLLYDTYFGTTIPTNESMLEEQKRLVQHLMQQKLLEKQQLAIQEREAQSVSEEKSIQAEEIQKQQLGIVQEKIESEKRKEQERLAEIEAQKQKEKERLARIEAEKEKERQRLSRIAEEKRKAREEAQRLEKNRLEALIVSELKNLEVAIAAADDYRNGEKYVEAKTVLEKALREVQTSPFREDGRLARAKKAIEEALSRDEIVYGSRGYVLYRNRWLSPSEYENTLLSEGYVKYKNEFKDYQSLSSIIIAKTEPLVKTFLSGKFKDERVHTTNVKFSDLSLKKNSVVSSEYGVDYTWKIWTFKGLMEGSCSMVVSYDVAQDKWYLIKGCQ